MSRNEIIAKIEALAEWEAVIEEAKAEGAILVVEWPERAGALIPAEAKHVVFTHLEGEESRRLEFR